MNKMNRIKMIKRKNVNKKMKKKKNQRNKKELDQKDLYPKLSESSCTVDISNKDIEIIPQVEVMNNKCAFIIPLHPKHYNYGLYIFNYLLDKNVDLYFVFTNKNDKDNFKLMIEEKNKENLNFLILNEYVNLNIVKKTNSFVSIKKIFALSKLYKKYDYISCIDSEIRFLDSNTNYYNTMKNIVDKKTICGGTLPKNAKEKKIVQDSLLRLTEKKYHKKLKNLSNNFRVYTWWCNLPVYDCKITEYFLKWINFKNNTLERFSWNVFDDMTYNFYCILKHGYVLKHINSLLSLEYSDTKLIEEVDKDICKLYWVNNKAYNQNKLYYEENNFMLVYHLDRY